MRIEEQPYDDRHGTAPKTRFDQVPPPGPIKVTPPAGRTSEGAMDRFAEIGDSSRWGKAVDIVPNIGALTTREYDIVLNPDEDLATVVDEFVAAAEVQMTGLHPLMWRQIASQGVWPRVQVQGELSRVLGFEEELNNQPAQKRLTANGWIKRYLDDYRTDVEWLRVVWLPEGPAPKGCDMAGCETGVRRRWAIAYRVPCERGTVPMDRELFVYCETTVMADNDVATFVEEGK